MGRLVTGQLLDDVRIRFCCRGENAHEILEKSAASVGIEVETRRSFLRLNWFSRREAPTDRG